MPFVVQWQWVTVPNYDLDVGIVNKFLGEVFPYQIYRIENFHTQQWDSDTIKFWVPRKLSEKEENDLKARGYRVNQS